MPKLNLVIVEDDEDERLFIKTAFEASGGFVVLADFDCGDTLVFWLNSGPTPGPDFILSDLVMHGIDGIELLSILKSDLRWAAIPVVITSIMSQTSIVEKCLALGAAHYLIKPEALVYYDDYVRNFPFRPSSGTPD